MELAEKLSKTKEILGKYPLCDRCLGRLLAAEKPEQGYKRLGEELKTKLLQEAEDATDDSRESSALLIKSLAETGFVPAQEAATRLGLPFEEKTCPICLGKLKDEVIETLASEALRKISLYEFEDFLVGAYIPKHIASIEERIFSEFNLVEPETLRKEITRDVGKRLESILKKPVNFSTPEMLVLVDIFTATAEAKAAPLYIFGHYLKLKPDIPQTPWYCSSCWGAGCERCGDTGRIYPDSVAEYICEPSMKLSGAIWYRFHAAGREDVDVIVEGAGRPFIVELIMPRRRVIPLDTLRHLIREYSGGRVDVENLALASRKDIDLLKEVMEGAVKRYIATVEFEKPISPEDMKKVESMLRGTLIEQLTPVRVLRRRGERMRRKRIHNISAKIVDTHTAQFEIEAEGGLYVKELIHGDSGRTRPSIAEIIDNAPGRITLRFLGVLKTLPLKKGES
ncbi:MAG: tRNA pseudouridine(54/55) synthase Pus10 [Nitrososphaerota archaeon]